MKHYINIQPTKMHRHTKSQLNRPSSFGEISKTINLTFDLYRKDPNSAKNENLKNPKTYLFWYTPKGISCAISEFYTNHYDLSFILKLEKSIFGPKMDPNPT